MPDLINNPNEGRSAVAAEGSSSAVSWAPIIGGAIAALATTLILVALGAGLGLTTVSPWSNSGVSATTFGIAGAIWLIVVQWLASAMGGYLTGRLRTKSVAHTDEVYFRDTAHGFLAWALATLVGAIFLASAVSSAVSGGARAVTSVISGTVQGADQAAVQSGGAGNATAYFVDMLFRSEKPAANGGGADATAEAGRILATDLQKGDVPAADRTYLGQLIAAKTGLAQADAEKRVDQVVTQLKDTEAKARQVADAARKTAASVSIILALSLLVGAFISSTAAALGGHNRDT